MLLLTLGSPGDVHGQAVTNLVASGKVPLVTLMWSVAEGAAGYYVQRKNPDGTVVVKTRTMITAARLLDTVPAYGYQYQVIARYPNGTSSPSAWLTFAEPVVLGGPAPTGTPVILSDATAPVALGTSADYSWQGAWLHWGLVPDAVGYAVCRESPPGNTCVNITPTRLAPGAPNLAMGWFDFPLPAQTRHAYRVSAYRADGHFGSSQPVTVDIAPLPAPGNFRIVSDSSAAGVLILGWDPVRLYPPGVFYENQTGTTQPAYQFRGTGFASAQTVTGNRMRVTLASGTNQWFVAPSVPNPAGGIFTSPQSATLTYLSTKYRLVALGLAAQQQSGDDPLERDGAGDEVYVAAVVSTTNKALAAPVVATVRGATYGDVGPSGKAFAGRLQGGTAGRNGGIRTGDIVPAGLNLAAGTGVPAMSAFPLLLWEGRLADSGMVVAHIALWEEDADRTPFGFWSNVTMTAAQCGYQCAVAGAFSQATVWNTHRTVIGELQTSGILGPRSGDNVMLCQDDLLYVDPLSGGCVAHGKDRPLGQERYFKQGAWKDRIVVLTRTAIEKALAGAGPRPGAAAGTIIVTFNDTTLEGKGMYELYLRVERIP